MKNTVIKLFPNNINLTINKVIFLVVGEQRRQNPFMRQVWGLLFPTVAKLSLFGGEQLNTTRKKIGSLIEFPSIYKNYHL